MTGPKNYLGLVRSDPDHEAHHTDLVAARTLEEGDKLDYGVKGMKWGVRKADASSESRPTHPNGHTGPTNLPPRSHNPPDGGGKSGGKDGKDGPKIESAPRSNDGPKHAAAEPSAVRYARLREQAKLGKAHLMSEDDLKFFNARTEALAKIQRLNETDPGWVSKTSKKVLQNVAERTLTDITAHVANKYITVPVTAAIGDAKKK